MHNSNFTEGPYKSMYNQESIYLAIIFEKSVKNETSYQRLQERPLGIKKKADKFTKN